MKKKNVTVYCGASFGVDKSYQDITRKLGEWIGKIIIILFTVEVDLV